MAKMRQQAESSSNPVTESQEKNKDHALIGTNNAAVPAKADDPDKALEPKKVGGRCWWMVWVGSGSLALSILLFIIYNTDPSNTFMAVMFVFFFAGGIGFLWFGLKKREENVYFKDVEIANEKKYKGKANCLNVYYRLIDGELRPDKIAFEWLPRETLIEMKKENRLGKYQKCRGDGNYYFVHELKPEKDKAGKYKSVDTWKLNPFILPDTMYFSPVELANVIGMPASTKYAKPKPGKLEKLRPVFLIIGAVLMGILIIATQAPPTA
jgi:uncharacterized integral membrane protein